MGAIGPKGKISKARRDKRRAQTWKISMPNLVACGKCGELVRTHRVCKACGSYNKREILKAAE
jgi:large subunit ribosomal protein L32